MDPGTKPLPFISLHPIQLPLLATILLEGFFKGALAGKLLLSMAKEVKNLSFHFTQGKASKSLPPVYMELKKFREAYILYYLPANLVKILYLLKKAFSASEDSWVKKKELTILDLGCGPGTAGLATLLFLHSLSLGKGSGDFLLRLYSADASSKVLFDCHRLTQTLTDLIRRDFPGWKIEHHTLSLHLLEGLKKISAPGPWDVIFFSNLLAEMNEDEEEIHQTLRQFVKGVLAPRGLAIFMEPAQKIYSRRLLGLRDALAGDAGLQILSPCPKLLQCPALRLSEKDWCHDRLEWERPDFIAAVDKLAGHRKESLKFTHLIIGKGHQKKGPGTTDQFVVVSELMEEKGKAFAFLCGETGRHKFELLKKDRTASNSAFFKVRRGDRMILHGYEEKKERRRIGKESSVYLLPSPFENI